MFQNLVTSQLAPLLPEKLLSAPGWQSKDSPNISLLSDHGQNEGAGTGPLIRLLNVSP